MIGNAPFFVVGVLFLMGIIAILSERNLVKISIGVSVIASAVNLFLVAMGYRNGGAIPIHYLSGAHTKVVLPIPQCLTLTAIVIALATTALMLALIMMLYKHYGTLDVNEIRRLRG